MEMHQVRYFVALARTLNFTRAAEECNVTQPSLTRAIKLLEHELGGELVRRERGLTHLTELGRRVLPLLTQCHESAVTARETAAAMKRRKVASLRLALPDGVPIGPFAGHLGELVRVFEGLALDIRRGGPAETAAALRDGEADLAVAEPESMTWERFESWPLFRDGVAAAVAPWHRLAEDASATPASLRGERLALSRRASAPGLDGALDALGLEPVARITVCADADARALAAAGAAVAVGPRSALNDPGLTTRPVDGLDLWRDLRLYAVAGRFREPPAAMLAMLLRAADWSAYAAEATA